jgi:hypothetical protein
MPKGTTHNALSGARKPGTAGHRALDPDVVRPRDAGADPDAAAAARPAVAGRSARDGEIEVGRVQHVRAGEPFEAFLLEPGAQHPDDPIAQCGRLHHAAVEEDVRRTGHPAGAAADRRAG